MIFNIYFIGNKVIIRISLDVKLRQAIVKQS